MRITKGLSIVLLLMCCTIGCGNGDKAWTPEKRASVSKTAGVAAASGYLVVAKPDKDTVSAIKIVIDKIKENLTGYRDGGFVGALPGIDEAIAKALSGDDNEIKRKAAHNLAKILLEELDKLFEDHPEWKVLGNEAAGIIGAFLEGASDAFKPYTADAPTPPQVE